MRPVGVRAVREAEAKLQVERREARRRARELGEARPELVAYLVFATQELTPRARGAAWSLFELVTEAMGARRQPRVALAEVLAVEKDNDELALSVSTAHPRFADRWLRHSGKLRQRALLRRLAADPDVPEGERGAVFLCLKTIVDVLDR